MDVAYDHITEDALASAEPASGTASENAPKQPLGAELQEAYKALSASPWGTRFGAFVGTVRKQGESYYESGRKEYSVVSEQASKGFSELRTSIVNRTRSLSLQQRQEAAAEGSEAAAAAKKDEGLLDKLRKGAKQRIEEIEAAERRADEYLLKFGTSIGSFLRDAVTIAPSGEMADGRGGREVLFETKTGEGEKRHIYTTRLDAQLHMLHTNLELFKQDPTGDAFAVWAKDFQVDGRTAQIAADLERYPELRASMEKLVPDQVQYALFWTRYYFLRNELDLEEQKRKDLLKGAAVDEEEVGWDEDDESDAETSDAASTPQKKAPTAPAPATTTTTSSSSTATTAATTGSTDTLTPAPSSAKGKAPATTTGATAEGKPKNSMDRTSQPDSESSYDLVSGVPSKAPSQAAGTPPKAKHDADDNDSDEDWE